MYICVLQCVRLRGNHAGSSLRSDYSFDDNFYPSTKKLRLRSCFLHDKEETPIFLFFSFLSLAMEGVRSSEESREDKIRE